MRDEFPDQTKGRGREGVGGDGRLLSLVGLAVHPLEGIFAPLGVAAANERRQQVNDLNTGLKHFRFRR